LAAGQDVGNRSMRRAGRTGWNEEDWNIAAAVVERLLGREREEDAA
jgi:hypothetical protein